MRYFHRGIAVINEWCHRLFHYIVPIVIVLFLFEVVARYVFNSPTLWGPETSEMLFGFLVFSSGGYLLLKNEHVRVDILFRRMPPRIQAVLNCVTLLLFFVFAGAYFWEGFKYAWQAWLIKETSGSVWDPPYWPYKWVLVVGFALLLLQGLSKLIQNLNYAIFGKGRVV